MTQTKLEVKYFDTSPYYDHLPDLFRLATIEDFYTEDNKLIMKKPYLIHSEVNPEKYWCFRTKPEFIFHNSFFEFLEKKRVYVLKDLTLGNGHSQN